MTLEATIDRLPQEVLRTRMPEGTHFLEGTLPDANSSNTIIKKCHSDLKLPEFKQRFIVYDPGGAGTRKRFFGHVDALNLDINNLLAIFATDIHADHVGLALEIQADVGDIPVYLPNAGKNKLLKRDPLATASYLYAHLNGNMYPIPNNCQFLMDGDFINIGGEFVWFHSMKGHSPSNSAYFFNNGLAIIGDSVNSGYHPELLGSNLADFHRTVFNTLPDLFRRYNTKVFTDGHSPKPYSADQLTRIQAGFGVPNGLFPRKEKLVEYRGRTISGNLQNLFS